MPAASNTAVVRDPSSVVSAPQHLAPGREAGAHEHEEALDVGNLHRRPLPAYETHQRGIDRRFRHEHRRGHEARELGGRVVRDLHRHRTVRVGSGPGGQSLAHLTLHHDEQPIDHWRRLEHAHDEWCRDVVREVRHHRPSRLRTQQRVPVDVERVAFLDPDRASLQHFAQYRNEMTVELERDDLRRARITQRERERTESRTDFDDARRS